MNRERRILIHILLAVCLIPLLFLLFMEIAGIGVLRGQLQNLYRENEELKDAGDRVSSLEKMKDDMEKTIETEKTAIFSSDEVSYYEFCDFIINSAKNRHVNIENYSTNEALNPQRITLTAQGEITDILSFLAFLDSYEKQIDVSQTVIALDSSKNRYTLSTTVNFITRTPRTKGTQP